MLTNLDLGIIALYFIITIVIGLSYRKQAGKDLSHFFLGGRGLSWFIAGISMVATTFAADTPLAVNELVVKNGISGNWLWWNALAGGMLTTFFFANLWRRSGVLTEVELIELRYSGREAAFLRGFKAVYLGLLMNVIVIGWVNAAMISILQGFFDISFDQALLYTSLAMLLVAVYSSVSGLMGVAVTDAIQFVIAMTGCIVLAYLVVNSEQIGGITQLQRTLNSSHPGVLSFFPTVGGSASAGSTLAIGVSSFFAYIGMQWWASWYPGAEPGGGGYVAQRMMSTRTERDAVYATLFFQIAHYCIRPWAWILVGLCAIVLYPTAEPRMGYILAMKQFLPSGLRGLLLVAFFAAYMSTIATQLNWGAGYLVNDLYHRFIDRQASERRLVMVARLATLLLMVVGLLVSLRVNSISGVWSFLLECGAGLGLVLILRWYWWRINAWSEITATIVPLLLYGSIKVAEWWLLQPLYTQYSGTISTEVLSTFYQTYPYLSFPYSYFITVGGTTIAWLLVTFATPPTDRQQLARFYSRVRPDGWWDPVQRHITDLAQRPSHLMGLLLCWISSVAMTYAVLFLLGYALFGNWTNMAIAAIVAVISFAILRNALARTRILED